MKGDISFGNQLLETIRKISEKANQGNKRPHQERYS